MNPSARERPPWWLVVIAAAFATYFGVLAASDLRRPEVAGFTLEVDTLRVAAVTPGSPADRAGVREGDRVIVANGFPIRTGHDWKTFEVHFTAPGILTLEVERGANAVPIAIPLRRIAPSYWATSTGAMLGISRSLQLVTLFLAILVVSRRPFDPSARIGAWLLASIAVFSIALPYGFAATWQSLPSVAGVLLWLPYASSLAVTSIMLTFFAGFPRPLLHSPLAYLALWLPTVPLLVVQTDRLRAHLYLASPLPVPEGWMDLINRLTPAVYAVAAVVSVALAYRQETDVTARRRVRIITFGSGIGLLGFAPIVFTQMLANAVLNSSAFSSPAVAAGTLIGLVAPASFAYAILRHRLFDVRFIVRRSLQYALARGVLLSVVPLAAAVFALDLWVNRQVPVASILQRRGWVYVGVAVFAAVARLRRQIWLNGLDRKFFRERYNAQRLLRAIAEDVQRAPTLEAAGPSAVAQIDTALHPTVAALMVKSAGTRSYECVAAAPADASVAPLAANSTIAGMLPLLQRPLHVSSRHDDSFIRQLPPAELDWVRRHGIELIVPVRAGTGGRGAFFVLGARRSEEPYSGEDEDLLATVGHAVALIPARESADGFEECPVCGCCYVPGTATCSQDGSGLVRQSLPHVLEGRYALTRRIGRGGMGTVYAADDSALDRRVAVKVLAEDLRDPAAADRFRAEAQSAAALAHPNVVTVYDIGVSQAGRAFFVMELLEGVSLGEELKRSGPLAAGRALQLLRGICAAVRMAHARRIVHRDLKPQNIFLCTGEAGETPKVLDFGLAKALEITRRHTLTQDGMVLGTLRYMSPEQLRGEEASVDADLWALGLIALEMLSGGDALERSPGTTPRLEHLPPLLHEAFAKALSLDPLDRPASVDELLESVERALINPGQPA